MAKPQATQFQVSVYPVYDIGNGYLVTKVQFSFNGAGPKYPNTVIEAKNTKEVIEKALAFASGATGEASAVQIGVYEPRKSPFNPSAFRKPAGFDAGTKRLYVNLDKIGPEPGREVTA